MGNLFSGPKDLNSFANGIKEGPNLRVNRNIVKFCSSDSSENLKIHYEKRRMEAGDCAADWTKSLVEKIAGLLPSPELMGLGALAIAVFIDIISFSPPEESTKEALRSVFAEEKASEVWDQIDFCLTEYMTYINNNEQLRSKLKQIEPKLGEALIKLKNSMVRDKQMSNDALKAWFNGAAFHIEMLIQLVRLGDTQTFDHVERRLSIYQNDLEALLVKHKEMIENKCSHREVSFEGLSSHYIRDEDNRSHYIKIDWTPHRYKDFFEAYYERKYSRQMSEIQQYFSNAGRNLQSRVNQRGFFTVK